MALKPSDFIKVKPVIKAAVTPAKATTNPPKGVCANFVIDTNAIDSASIITFSGPSSASPIDAPKAAKLFCRIIIFDARLSTVSE